MNFFRTSQTENCTKNCIFFQVFSRFFRQTQNRIKTDPFWEISNGRKNIRMCAAVCVAEGLTGGDVVDGFWWGLDRNFGLELTSKNFDCHIS